MVSELELGWFNWYVWCNLQRADTVHQTLCAIQAKSEEWMPIQHLTVHQIVLIQSRGNNYNEKNDKKKIFISECVFIIVSHNHNTHKDTCVHVQRVLSSKSWSDRNIKLNYKLIGILLHINWLYLWRDESIKRRTSSEWNGKEYHEPRSYSNLL